MLIAQTRELMEKAGDRWCRTFHNHAMWPIHGRYLCRLCLRSHEVCWEASNRTVHQELKAAKPEIMSGSKSPALAQS